MELARGLNMEALDIYVRTIKDNAERYNYATRADVGGHDGLHAHGVGNGVVPLLLPPQ